MEENKNTKNEKSDDEKIRDTLVAMHDKGDRYNHYKELMKLLSYDCPEDAVETCLLVDAFLIKVTLQEFDGTEASDILLMSLGLMDGYYYLDHPRIEKRRAKYLHETHYYKNKPPYDMLDKKEQRKARNNFSKDIEEKCLWKLASFLLEQKDDIESYINEPNKYVNKTGKKRTINLPTPSYKKEKYEPEKQIKIRCVSNGEKIFSVQAPIYTKTDKAIVIDISKKTANLMTNASDAGRKLKHTRNMLIIVVLIAGGLAGSLISYKHDSYSMSYHENKPTEEDFQKNPPSSSGNFQEDVIVLSADEFE